MISQIINRIVCCTNTFNVVTTHKASCCIFWLLKFFVTFIIYFTGCLRAQELIYAKSSLQLKVCPMIKRVSECIRNSLSPFFKFFPIASFCSCAILLVNAVSTHSTPFVMITAQPQLCYALEFVVVSDHFRNQMAMIVNNRHFCRMIMK